mmetsp:Transcript_29666/g.61927  ORF Transcript_29666/g.61927 Transcript_29666/m.61927 type:complete len:141 (-) Transcript_29666:507-929(-)
MIDKTIMSMLEIAVSAVHQATNIVSPIGGSGYTHNREESRQKKTMMKIHPKEKVKLVMLDSFVKDHTAKTPIASSASKPTAKKASRSQPKQRTLPMSTVSSGQDTEQEDHSGAHTFQPARPEEATQVGLCLACPRTRHPS